MIPPGIEINEGFRKALDLMESGSGNVFITGKAGTGKSTLLEYFRERTRKNAVVLAPTGVAAVNVRGETIHSFFGFRPTVTLDKIKKIGSGRQKLYRNLDAVVIDEISMVRADLLDCVDKFLRLNGPDSRKPFGGIPMICIGDLYQLPPVTPRDEEQVFRSHYDTPYFFSARAFREARFEYVELEKIYRQKDEKFIEILNGVRNNTLTDELLERLNRRVRLDSEGSPDDLHVHLTTTNALAEEINREKLEEIRRPLRVFSGKIQGDFDRKYLPAPEKLALKTGAQVMLLNNDASGRWVNGTMGRVESIPMKSEEEEGISVQLDNGETVQVQPYLWELSKYSYDTKISGIRSDAIGAFRQFPLRLAWSITVHKSQGKTFDKVVVDLRGGVFAPGQVYVALSRCRSLEGIVLKKPLRKNQVFLDRRIVEFLTSFQYGKSEESIPLREKIEIIRNAVENERALEITYLKGSNEKSARKVAPEYVGDMEYQGKSFLGMRGYDFLRREPRTFRIDRILELQVVDPTPLDS